MARRVERGDERESVTESAKISGSRGSANNITSRSKSSYHARKQRGPTAGAREVTAHGGRHTGHHRRFFFHHAKATRGVVGAVHA